MCRVLDLSPVPELYIDMGFLNAWTTGVEQPIIVITSGCTSLLTYDELVFIIGHEAGHIKSEHVLYHQMAEVLPYLGGIIASATLGLGGLVAAPLQVALLNWHRMSEYTADRAGLLACQNPDAATSAMMKIAGAPPKYYRQMKVEHFEQQAREFEELDASKLDHAAKILSVMFASHPWTVMRGHELFKWIETGAYDEILRRKTMAGYSALPVGGSLSGQVSQGWTCTNCRSIQAVDDKFCTECGTPQGGSTSFGSDLHVNLTCSQCGKTNRVPRSRIADGPVCGSCRAPLPVG